MKAQLTNCPFNVCPLPPLSSRVTARNGRWRSVWTLDTSTNEVKGTLRCKVHYYEDGNVQLDTTKEIEGKLSKGPSESESNYAKVSTTAHRYTVPAFFSLSLGHSLTVAISVVLLTVQADFEGIAGDYRFVRAGIPESTE